MKGNRKWLGLVLAAALALSGFSASSASAASFDSESSATTVLTGAMEDTDVFSTTAGTLSCTEIAYIGSQSESSTESTSVEPSFAGCTAFGFAGATVNTNGCEYEFHANGTMDIQGCNSAAGIILTSKLFGVTKCTLTFVEQSGVGGISYTNTGSGSTRGTTVDMNVNNELAYVHHAGSGIGACTNGSASDGDYAGTTLFTGLNLAKTAHVGIWWTS